MDVDIPESLPTSNQNNSENDESTAQKSKQQPEPMVNEAAPASTDVSALNTSQFEEHAEDDTEADPNKANASLDSLPEVTINDVIYHVGEFAYIRNEEEAASPHIVLITAVWKDQNTHDVTIRYHSCIYI
jgi:hypothetical protein